MELFTYEIAKQVVVLTIYSLMWVVGIWWYGYCIISIFQLLWHGVKKSIKKIKDRTKLLSEDKDELEQK